MVAAQKCERGESREISGVRERIERQSLTHCGTFGCFQHGNTPLMYGASNGHLEVVEYLLEKGADLEARNTVRKFT